MLRSRTSLWLVATVLVSALLMVAGWFLLISPRQAQASELREENVSAQENNDLLELKIAQLKAQSATLSEAEAELATIQRQMPDSAQMPQLVRDVNRIADETGVELTSVAPGQATALSEESSTTQDSSGSATTTSKVVQIPLSIVVEGDYFQVVAYLQKLQTQLNRVILVTGIAITEADTSEPDADTDTISVTITGSAFVLKEGGVSTDSSGSSSSSGTSGGSGTSEESQTSDGSSTAPSSDPSTGTAQ
jgi:type IV pilus assembly protein PilO